VRKGISRIGARYLPQYRDTRGEHILVSRADLRDVSTYGWLQEGVGGIGMFFFSGAFWLLATILVEHSKELDKVAPWIGMCILSIIFGAVLIGIAHTHFSLKKERINDYFEEQPSDS
jgi:tetrahydromethanopterin S-methyltransferase subunit C